MDGRHQTPCRDTRRARRRSCIPRSRPCRASSSPSCSCAGCARRCATPLRQRAAGARRMQARACGRTTCARWTTSRLPFTPKTDLRDHYPYGMFARPRSSSRGCTRPRAPPASPPWSATRGRTSTNWADLMARSLYGAAARARRRRPQRLWLRPVHRRPGRALRRRAAGRRGGADVGRRHRAAGGADPGLRRARAVRHAVLCAGDRRGGRAAGRRPAQEPAARRPVRRRALERRRCARDRGAARAEGGRRLRPVRDHGARASPANAACSRACTAGRTTSCSRSSIPRPAAGAGGPSRRAGDHHADQAGAADAALPHARHHALHHGALRVRPHARAHPAHHRPQRRHADHPRRQRLSLADRGGAGRPAGSRRTTSWWCSGAACWTRWRSRSRRSPACRGDSFAASRTSWRTTSRCTWASAPRSRCWCRADRRARRARPCACATCAARSSDMPDPPAAASNVNGRLRERRGARQRAAARRAARHARPHRHQAGLRRRRMRRLHRAGRRQAAAGLHHAGRQRGGRAPSRPSRAQSPAAG